MKHLLPSLLSILFALCLMPAQAQFGKWHKKQFENMQERQAVQAERFQHTFRNFIAYDDSINQARLAREEALIGQPQNEIYKAYGPPDRIMNDGSDGQILIYFDWSKRMIWDNRCCGTSSVHHCHHAHNNSYWETYLAGERMWFVDNEGLVYHKLYKRQP